MIEDQEQVFDVGKMIDVIGIEDYEDLLKSLFVFARDNNYLDRSVDSLLTMLFEDVIDRYKHD